MTVWLRFPWLWMKPWCDFKPNTPLTSQQAQLSPIRLSTLIPQYNCSSSSENCRWVISYHYFICGLFISLKCNWCIIKDVHILFIYLFILLFVYLSIADIENNADWNKLNPLVCNDHISLSHHQYKTRLIMPSRLITCTDHSMMTSSNGNIFRITGPLCGEFTGHRWIPQTKASDAELWCFPWSVSE